jgi:hypothetical protein
LALYLLCKIGIARPASFIVKATVFYLQTGFTRIGEADVVQQIISKVKKIKL